MIRWLLLSALLGAGPVLAAGEADDPGLPAKPPVTVPETTEDEAPRDLTPAPRPMPNSAFDDQGRIAPQSGQADRLRDNNLSTIRRGQQPGYSVGEGNIITRTNPAR